jgi:hypothetical protein
MKSKAEEMQEACKWRGPLIDYRNPASPSWESQMSYHMGQPPPGSFGSVGPGYTSTARIEPGVYYLTSPCVVHSQPKSLSVSMGHLEQGPHTGSSESYPSRGHMGYEQQGHHTGGFGFNPSSGSMCYPQQGYPTVRSEPYPSSGHPKQGPHHTGGSGSNPSSGDMAYQQQRHHTGRSEPFSSSGDTRNPQQSHRKPRGKSSVTVASLLQSPSTRSPPRR